MRMESKVAFIQERASVLRIYSYVFGAVEFVLIIYEATNRSVEALGATSTVRQGSLRSHQTRSRPSFNSSHCCKGFRIADGLRMNEVKVYAIEA